MWDAAGVRGGEGGLLANAHHGGNGWEEEDNQRAADDVKADTGADHARDGHAARAVNDCVLWCGNWQHEAEGRAEGGGHRRDDRVNASSYGEWNHNRNGDSGGRSITGGFRDEDGQQYRHRGDNQAAGHAQHVVEAGADGLR